MVSNINRIMCSRGAFQIVILVSALMLSVSTYSNEKVFQLDIPPQDAVDSLDFLAEKTQSSLFMPTSELSDVRTNALLGSYSLPDALEDLLKGTGLNAVVTDNDVIAISIAQVIDEKQLGNEENNMQSKNKLSIGFLALLGAILEGGTVTPAVAQEIEALSLDEILVTGRKREESLQEIPVSISVLSESLLSDAGIVDQYDLFEMVPGIHYDEFFDRNAAQASVRGVQSNEVATNRTKVTAFVDGMPILGSQGSIGFGNIQQVEVYRGPQSAAFGRSTFGGAINYITRDPGDDFEGTVNLNVNDYGTRIFGASVGGPLTETLGYLLNVEVEDSTAPDDYVTTDGLRYGERAGTNLSGKFVWTPNDSFEAKLNISHVKTEDAPTVDIFISEAARDACAGTIGNAGDTGIDSFRTVGRRSGVYNIGLTDCDWTQGAQLIAQNDRELFLRNDVNGLGDLATYAAAARANGASDATSVNGSVEEDILMVAAAHSARAGDVGGFDERDRVTLQMDYLLDNGHSVQLSAMKSEEEYVRLFDESGNYTDSLDITSVTDLADPQGVVYAANIRGPINRFMADPSEISEDYLELRWVSPADERLRYVAGVSQYQYDFETVIFINMSYGAILGDFVDEYEQLSGVDQTLPTRTISETATNSGAFFNVAYDVTDKLTATLEGRYQSDDVSGVDPTTGNSGSVLSKGFIPRLSFNYNFSDTTSYYLQLAKGVNPAGVNTSFFNDSPGGFVDTLDNGIPDGFGNNADLTTDAACTGAATATDPACNSYYVDYDSTTFDSFDEETLTNIEFGFKGSVLDGRLQYAGAIYNMSWKDQANAVNLAWDHPNIAAAGETPGVTPIAAGAPNPFGLATVVAETDSSGSRTFVNTGDLKMRGAEIESTFLINNNWDVRTTASYLDATFDDGYCSVEIYNTRIDAHSGLPILTQEDGVLSTCVLVEGKEINRQPKLTFSVSPSFSTDLSSGLRLNARTDLTHESEQWLDVANVSKSEAVTSVNFSLGLSGDAWNATLYVNNLFDDDTPRQFERAADRSITSDLPIIGNSNYYVQPRIPRSIGLRASYNF